jgi:hypothetical protein
MKLKKPHNIMLDGSRTGTSLSHLANASYGSYGGAGGASSVDQSESKMELSEDESAQLKIMMDKAGAVVAEREMRFNVTRKKSTMCLSMRANENNAKKKYLNLSGNPLTFITGSNVYGSPNPVKQLKFCWNKCLERLERDAGMKAPKRIHKEIEKARIHINSLEWACYTEEMRDPLKMLNEWHSMFHLTRRKRDDGMQEFLADMLNVQWIDSQYKDSFRLKILDAQRRTVCMIGFYDKATEMVRKAEEMGEDVEAVRASIPDTIRNRLRLDIQLTHLWFKNKRATRLDDLIKLVGNPKTYDGDWGAMIRDEVMKVVDKTHLVRMFQLNGKKILEAHEAGMESVPGMPQHIPTELLVQLLYARATKDMDTQQMADYLSAKPKALERVRATVREIRPLKDAKRFAIDMSPVKIERTEDGETT